MIISDQDLTTTIKEIVHPKPVVQAYEFRVLWKEQGFPDRLEYVSCDLIYSSALFQEFFTSLSCGETVISALHQEFMGVESVHVLACILKVQTGSLCDAGPAAFLHGGLQHCDTDFKVGTPFPCFLHIPISNIVTYP